MADEAAIRAGIYTMAWNAIGGALVWIRLPERHPGPAEIRIRVSAGGVCHTDLHAAKGDWPSRMVLDFGVASTPVGVAPTRQSVPAGIHTEHA